MNAKLKERLHTHYPEFDKCDADDIISDLLDRLEKLGERIEEIDELKLRIHELETKP